MFCTQSKFKFLFGGLKQTSFFSLSRSLTLFKFLFGGLKRFSGVKEGCE
jgi:hypothetical protein